MGKTGSDGLRTITPERRREDLRWWNENRGKLLPQYAGKHIAVVEGQIAAGDSREQVEDRLIEIGARCSLYVGYVPMSSECDLL